MEKSQNHQEESAKHREKVQDENLVKNQWDSKEVHTCCTNPKLLQIYARSLFVLGVGIILAIFYLAIMQPSGIKTFNIVNGKVEATSVSPMVVEDMNTTYSDQEQIYLEDDENESEIANKPAALQPIGASLEKPLNTCREDFCRIICGSVRNVFTAVDNAVKKSACKTTNDLWLENENFPLNVLRNNWLPANKSLTEVVIQSENLRFIDKAAFNVPLFHNTLLLSLNLRNIKWIDKGALQGFKRLKYFTLQSHIKRFRSSVLRPVQHTLQTLKLTGHIYIRGMENHFEGIFLYNLDQLEVSNSYFIRNSLGKKFFKSMPNLRHVILRDDHLQYMEGDAFETLADKLLYLNIEGNRLTTIASGMLQPMLIRQHKAVINLADNDWVCDCQLKSLAEFYKAHIQQFPQILYCKRPHHLYGVSLNKVNFGLQNCKKEA